VAIPPRVQLSSAAHSASDPQIARVETGMLPIAAQGPNAGTTKIMAGDDGSIELRRVN